jgi:hypothetical protein
MPRKGMNAPELFDSGMFLVVHEYAIDTATFQRPPNSLNQSPSWLLIVYLVVGNL